MKRGTYVEPLTDIGARKTAPRRLLQRRRAQWNFLIKSPKIDFKCSRYQNSPKCRQTRSLHGRFGCTPLGARSFIRWGREHDSSDHFGGGDRYHRVTGVHRSRILTVQPCARVEYTSNTTTIALPQRWEHRRMSCRT